MIIPDDRIDDFIKRWENAFGETLSRDEARTRAMQLIELYKAIGRGPSKERVARARQPPEEPRTRDELGGT